MSVFVSPAAIIAGADGTADARLPPHLLGLRRVAIGGRINIWSG